MRMPKSSWLLLVPLMAALLLAGCGPAEEEPTPTPPDPAVDPTPTPVTDDPPTPDPTPARDLTEHFQGRTVTINVGFAAGGGYDIFARLVSAHIGRHLPGEPRFVVQNLPGAGGERGLITTMQAEPDGRTLHVLHPRFVRRELAGVDVPNFDLDTVTVVGSPTGGAFVTRLYCSDPSVASTWEEVLGLGREITDGATEPGDTGGLAVAFLQELGAPMRVVYGYGGTAEIMAAFDRGELDGTTRCEPETVLRLYPEWVDQGRLAPLFWWEGEPDQEWLNQLGAPMPPHVLELPGMEFTEDQRNVFEAMIALSTLDRIFVMPPGVDEDIVQAWRDAFLAVMEDPEFQAGAAAAGYELGLATADDFHNTLQIAERISPEGMELFTRLVGTD